MAFTKFLYNIIGWKNKSDSLTTPLGATNLNKMDSAIKTIGDNLNAAYDELSEGKLDKDTANTMISNVSYAESTGIFTITRLNGSSFTFDTKLEKIVTNWDYDKDTQKLILTLEDGTTKYIDLSALITQYEFVESDTIAFTIESNGTVTANVKDGSITEEKLQPNYLAEVKSNASNAETSAQNASDYADDASYDAKLAQSYAVGGSGIRDGEDADNAKYYMEQAKSFSEGTASNISYNNSESGAESTNVQEALDELNNKKINKDKISNNFITTEEGFVADARTVKGLKDEIDSKISLCQKYLSEESSLAMESKIVEIIVPAGEYIVYGAVVGSGGAWLNGVTDTNNPAFTRVSAGQSFVKRITVTSETRFYLQNLTGSTQTYYKSTYIGAIKVNI